VDVQPSHPGSSPHRRKFGFLFSKNQNRCRGFPYRISFQKKIYRYVFDVSLSSHLVDLGVLRSKLCLSSNCGKVDARELAKNVGPFGPRPSPPFLGQGDTNVTSLHAR
jgi:hypothetical protein